MFEGLDLLVGTSVLDLGLWRPGPFGAQLLAELGATVVKVEPPGGDPMRAFPALYRSLNERKRVVELDLKDDADRGQALALATESDVVVEAFRPGVADRLGVGYRAVAERNPSVVYCSVSGYGQEGPLADAPGHDVSYQAWSGALAARLPEVSKIGVPIADLAGGAYAALAVCAAVAARSRTGEGRRIDVSMTDVLVTWAGIGADGDVVGGPDPGADFPGYGVFPCRDGHVTLGVVTEDRFWRSLCEALDLPDAAGLDARERAEDGARLRSRIAAAMATRDRDPLVAQLLEAGVPVAPVLSRGEAVRSDHARARGLADIGPDGSVRIGHPVRFT